MSEGCIVAGYHGGESHGKNLPRLEPPLSVLS